MGHPVGFFMHSMHSIVFWPQIIDFLDPFLTEFDFNIFYQKNISLK